MIKLQLFCSILLLAAIHLSGSQIFNFNADWRFIKADVPGAEVAEFDDDDWETVSAPHTYNDVDTFDDFSPPAHAGEMEQWGGKTWYRKSFYVPREWTNKRVMIEFEAVRQVGIIYINGVEVGGAENGFLPFGADLSEHLKFGAMNVVALSCDNEFVKDTDGNRKEVWHNYFGGAKFPWNNPHWHPAHGGIYRNVFLHVTEKLHLTEPLYNNLGTVGTYAYAIEPSRASTGVGVEVEVSNANEASQAFRLVNRLLDREGNTVLVLSDAQQLGAGETAIFENQGLLEQPWLWEPKHPYIYTLVTEILQDGVQVARNEIPFAVRWVEMNTTTGFFINNRHVKLQGWGMKSVDGWPGLGAANPDWMHHYTLEKITEAGGNFVRWGHTAGSPAQLRAADRLGIITMQPGVDGEGDNDGHAWNIRAQAWRDTVIYYRNSPSLLFWEGGNQSLREEHTRQMKEIVETYDPHGGRLYGHRRANNVVKPFCDITISTEGSGFIAALPTVEGEYNREESPRRVWDRDTPPYEDWEAVGTYNLTAEDFALNQVYQYEKIAPVSHGGGANWIFVDSTSGGRVQSEVTRTSGEIDAMRLPKEAYHVCRVIFSDEPDLHVIGHWNYPGGTVRDMHVVADMDRVQLMLNGEIIGDKEAADSVIGGPLTGREPMTPERQHPMIFTFEDVVWQPGELLAVGFKDGDEVARHAIKTTGPAVALHLSATTGPEGWLANGSDAVVIDIEAVDADGRRVPTFNGRVDFELSCPGIWRGGYNSGKEDSTNHPYLDLESGINRVIVRSTRQPGLVEVTAHSEGLESGMIDLSAGRFVTWEGLSKELPKMPETGELMDLGLPDNSHLEAALAAYERRANRSSELLEDVSYSGPSGTPLVVAAGEGERLFPDHPERMPELPEFLLKGERIRLPNLDWNFSAVDLLQFNVKADATVYVAHNVRIREKMDWLTSGYEPTGDYIESGRHRWQLWRRDVEAGESVLMGSNSELQGLSNDPRMMLVYVVPR
jgi:beta-galactosidase